ncbi:hypothetical protein TNCV_4285061 [Trichonephila clavipes]|nr:hypothetical protein TNCV_4285061 [Trichonephila clavipes]
MSSFLVSREWDNRNRWRDGQVCPDVGQGIMAPWARRPGGHQRTQRDKPSNLGEKTEDMPTQRDKPSNLGEKTEDMPTQRDKPSNLGEKTEDMPTQRDKPSNLVV